MEDILTWFSTLEWIKIWFQSTYERDFDMIFYYKEAQNLVADHYVGDIFTWFFTIRRGEIWLQSTMK